VAEEKLLRFTEIFFGYIFTFVRKLKRDRKVTKEMCFIKNQVRIELKLCKEYRLVKTQKRRQNEEEEEENKKKISAKT
jgi:hypothetical protein